MHRNRRFASRRESEQGSAMIFVAITLAVLCCFAGLTIDHGRAASQHRLAQNAADAAALGAAYEIEEGNSESVATAAADIVVQQHGLPAADLITLNYLDSNGAPTSDQYSVASVQAIVADSFRTFLMSILGIPTVTVSSSATSTISVTPNGLCALCVLDPHARNAFTGSGSESIAVTGGGIAVNSDASPAATVSGGATVSAPIIGVVGGSTTSGGSAFSPAPKTITPVADPLASVPDPACPSGNPQNQSDVSGTQTISPGTYSTITATTGNTITLNAGTYCITSSFKASGSGIIQGSGVMLYFTCGTYPTTTACASGGQAGGSFALTGGSNYPITAPTSGMYKGLVVFYDRNNTSPFSMAGGTADQISGTIYCKSSLLTMTGGSGMTQQFSMIIAGTVSLNGHAQLDLQYNAGVDYQPKLLPVLTN